ncbi:helix-turn-helix transcriptional regulator [Kitasatospora sp. P5_F3]
MYAHPPTDHQLAERRRVGEAIRALREARRLSQDQLGEAVGVDRRTMSTYEVGSVAMSLDRITAVALALGVEPWQLLYPR